MKPVSSKLEALNLALYFAKQVRDISVADIERIKSEIAAEQRILRMAEKIKGEVNG
jgi:hypothetical protein